MGSTWGRWAWVIALGINLGDRTWACPRPPKGTKRTSPCGAARPRPSRGTQRRSPRGAARPQPLRGTKRRTPRGAACPRPWREGWLQTTASAVDEVGGKVACKVARKGRRSAEDKHSVSAAGSVAGRRNQPCTSYLLPSSFHLLPSSLRLLFSIFPSIFNLPPDESAQMRLRLGPSL